MEVISASGIVLSVLAILLGLFLYGFLQSHSWVGTKGL